MRNAHTNILENSERKRPFQRVKGRWKNDIKLDLEEMGNETVNWIQLAQDGDPW
jgi:hypothetical protein